MSTFSFLVCFFTSRRQHHKVRKLCLRTSARLGGTSCHETLTILWGEAATYNEELVLGMSQAATGKRDFFQRKKGIFFKQKRDFFEARRFWRQKSCFATKKSLFFFEKKSLLLRATEKGFFSKKAREWLSSKKIPFLAPETWLST